ncbi:GNAT family N-acetyltransferase [Micromonospora endolithica]|uniref:GNAT N-acetyltransferase n=1 Tax=Micromonospora endolithica TaxID=230091 RepID=A0A3A9YS46_9ACTN|nr:GNAT family N-acetyltransferase [Micromonospora endolithica]RKN38076.1 GNAT N-acetyltransferase [Micromonospora endolithica]TWJ23851.1 RimJ/RimL family protein N-acetyltransferase [Micromonospora endolithica]
MEPVEIVEDGLLLRRWRATDADAVHRAGQDPDIQRWTNVPRPYLPEHARGFVAASSDQLRAEGGAAPFAVCDAATGDVLGSCGLVTLDRAGRTGEIGYWTAPWARGRGVAVRATRAVTRWAFDALGLRQVIWRAETGNHAARLVALRAGFRVEGRLRLGDEGRDGWIGSLRPGEVPAPGETGPAGPGTLDARRAAVFGRPQPTLFATVQAGELRLRPLEERDLDDVVDACRDPETTRWTTVPDPYQRADAEWYLGYGRSTWAGGTNACFAIADPGDRFAGTVDLRLSPTDPLLADVGYFTAARARGRGFMPAALTALGTWGFATLGLARIEWRAHVGNTASRRAAEKAGFTVEGTVRGGVPHRGERVDAWIGGLLAEDVA